MKTAIGLILLVVGTAMMIAGFAWAVWEFAQMYGATLDDPMNSNVDAKRTSSTMLTAAGVGIAGFVPATIGSIILGKGIIGRIAKRLTKQSGPAVR